jgi:branched-chain amino acid aminotransferase
VNASAAAFRLKPSIPVEEWVGLARDGISRFDHDAELYIRPMY